MDCKKLIVLAGPLVLLGGSALNKPEQKPLRFALVTIGGLAMLYACCRDYARSAD